MNRIPEFSVIITAHNKGGFVAEAINSVLNQTYQDFEIVVVDDGSTDNTKEKVLSIRDNRIRYIYQENSGLPACARNKGMKLSCGNYIALLDGDDYWHRDKLKITKSIFDDKPWFDIVYHNIGVVDGGRVVRYSSFASYTENMYENLLYKGNCLCPSAVVLKRKVVFDDGYLFDESKYLFTIEDYEYWLRLARNFRLFLIKDILGYYRVTVSGIFLSNIEANMANMLRLLDGHFSKINSTGKYESLRVKKRRSSVISSAGRMYHHKSIFTESMKCYNMALKEYPLNFKAMVGIIFSFFNVRVGYK